MDIFAKRPLGLILCIFLCGFSLYSVLNSYCIIFLILISLLVFLLSFFVEKLNTISVKTVSLTIIISFLLAFIYFDLIFYPKQYYNKSDDMVGTVIDTDTVSEGFSSIDLMLSSIGDESVNYKVKVFIYGGNNELSSGNVISFRSSISEFENDDSFDSKSFYTSKGFSALIYADSYTIIDESTDTSLTKIFQKIRRLITQRAISLSDERSGGLLSALLIGERADLDPEVSLDFKRIGIFHILSLSGMHLSILCAALEKILYSLRVHKKLRYLIEIIFVFAFMALTGFPITVCRAGVMLIISSLLMIISGKRDGITSLFIAAFVLLLIQPYSATDLGFLLSIFSTFGILTASQIIEEKKTANPVSYTLKKKFFDYFKISIVFSLFALASSFFISVINFQAISNASVFTTLLFSPLIELFVYFGIIFLLFGSLIPLGPILIFLSDLICNSSAALSNIDGIYSSTGFWIVKFFGVAVSVVFFVLLIVKLKRAKIIIPIISVMIVMASVMSITLTFGSNSIDEELLRSNEYGDLILVKNNSEALLFDNSAYSASSAYDASSYLYDKNIMDLDYYYVTHYSQRLPVTIKKLLSNIKIGKILLPFPKTEKDEAICLEAYGVLKQFACDVQFIKEGESFGFSDFEIVMADSNNGSNAVLFINRNEIISYLSEGALDNCYDIDELLYVSNYLIFGNYGTDYDNTKYVSSWSDRVERIIVLDDKIILNGEFLDEKNTDVITGVSEFKIR